MATSPVRVPEAVHGEVKAAARLLGCNTAELLERAWDAYRQTPEFVSELEAARKAFASGDLDLIASQLHEQAQDRARSRAAAVRNLREPQ